MSLPICAGVQNHTRQVEFLLELEAPLFPQACRADDDESPLSLCPVLAQNEASFDRLAKADFVGEENALRQWVPQGKGGSVDLVRIEVDAGVKERHREAITVGVGMLPRDLVSEIPGVIGSGHGASREFRRARHPAASTGHYPAVFAESGQRGRAVAPRSNSALWCWCRLRRQIPRIRFARRSPADKAATDTTRMRGHTPTAKCRRDDRTPVVPLSLGVSLDRMKS